MSQLTKIQLESENQSSFPNNTSNFITPQALREFNTDMIQSTVNQTIYTADSASFSQRITQNQGVQGIQGVQGSQGIQGIQGSQGIQGVQGSDATVQGIQGSTGIQGIQGLQGLQGIQGLRGTQGTTGAQGYTGNTGNVGSTGAQGAQGLSGNNAGQGTTGAQGQQGTQGATGIQGAQGIQGIQGLQGVTQYTGSFAITGSNTFFGEQTIVGNVTFPSGSFISSNNVSGNLYFSALNNGILHLNDDGGEGDVIIGYVGSAGKLKVKTDTEITGSLFVSGNVYANNLTGSVIDSGSFITTGSAGQTQSITGSLDVRTITTLGLSPTPSTANTGSGTQLYFLNSDINGNVQPSIFNITEGWVMSGDGITDGTVTSVGGDDNGIYVDITSGNVVSASSYIGTGPFTPRLIVNGGVFTDNGFVSPGGLIVQNEDGTGFQYGGVGINASGVDPTNIYSSFALSGDTSEAGIALSLNSYSPEYSGKPVPMLNGGGYYTGTFGGSDTTMTFYSSSIQNWKPTQFKAPVNITGSLAVSGSTNFTELTGSLATFSASVDSRINSGGGTSNFATTGSNTFTGQQTLTDVDRLNQVTLGQHSGSLVLYGKGSTSSSLSNITINNSISTGANIIFKNNNNTATTIVSGSGNIFTNPSAATAGFNRFIGTANNIHNTAAASQITASMQFAPTMTGNYFTNQMFMRGPITSSGAWSIASNIVPGTITLGSAGGTLKIDGGLSLSQNNVAGTLIVNANTNVLSGSVTTIQNNTIAGNVTLTLNTSTAGFSNNIINDSAFTLTNGFYSSSIGLGLVSFNRNNVGGQSNALIVSGGQPTGTTNAPSFSDNFIGGGNNTIYGDIANARVVGANAYHSAIRNIIGGNGLIVSASSALTDTTSFGSAYFGRWNDINAGLADTGKTIFAVGTGTSTSNRRTALSVDSSSVVNISGSLTVTSSTLNIDGSGNVTASAFTATGGNTKAFSYQGASSGGVNNTFNTALGRDYLDIYQYQGQAYAFNMHLTSDQLNTYSGSQFSFQLQTNGSGVSIPGGGATYFAMVSASYSSSVGPGTEIPGLDVLGSAMVLDMKAPSTFKQKVYLDKGLYVSASAGTSGPALTINTNNGTALIATGSVKITGSLEVNGNSVATLASNTFTQNQIVSSSIYIAPNSNSNQLYLPSGSNKQTGLATLDGGNPGTVTISNTNVTANSIIMLTKQTLTNTHMVAVSSKGSDTFTITSNGNGDTDEVAYMIINPS